MTLNMTRAKSKREKDLQRKKEYDLRKKQVSTVTKYIYSTAYRDRVLSEIVCTQTPEQLDKVLTSSLAVGEPQSYFPLVEVWRDGLVLASSLTYSFNFQ